MKIQTRGTNAKRHTIEWKVGGKWRTRRETVSLAKQGRIPGVFVRTGAGLDEQCIVSLPGERNLYDLPARVRPV